MKTAYITLALLLTGCAAPQSPRSGASTGADAAFTALAKEFLSDYLEWRPQMGTSLGLHQYDGKLTDYSRASIDRELARLRSYDKRLDAIDARQLSRRNHYDYRILQTAVKSEIFHFDEMAVYRQNPMTYAGAIDVNIYIKRDFAPLVSRVRSIIAIEKQAPVLIQAAKANLDDALPEPFIETAIEVANGSADFLGKDLVTALKDLPDKSLHAEFDRVNQQAIDALRGYADYLKKEKMPKATQKYALGRQNYGKMLRYGELIDLSPDKILELGLKELAREQKIFADTARLIDSTKPAIEVFKAIQADHPTEQNLIPDTKRNLEAIRQFLIDHKIVTLPSNVRARVEETPQFARATSFASMDTPGPFETKATEAYYYVTPVEKEWPEKQKEEWLTAFNYYTTDVVSIHEAYPGHYTQFLSLNASSANTLEKVLGSYAFTEGWAHYTEQMLLDEGFGRSAGKGDGIKAAKYRLAQSDEALLRLCRLCVSVKMHCFGMTVDEATKFFEENCYYTNKPAHQEAMRGSYDPGYLYYTLGKLQILKLRRDYQAQEGTAYSLQRFHDEMLRHGMPPIRLLREVLLKNEQDWPAMF